MINLREPYRSLWVFPKRSRSLMILPKSEYRSNGDLAPWNYVLSSIQFNAWHTRHTTFILPTMVYCS